MKIGLGDEVKDSVTGFTGIAVAVTEWLNGCYRVTVQPRTLDAGKVPASEPQLEVLQASVIPCGSRDTGGPAPTPRQHAGPTR
jgi:hypothetical protein